MSANSLQYYKDLIIVLTQKELKVRYKNSFLGYLWSIANPLAFAFIYFVVFSVIIRIQVENFALFLIAGLFPWQWFANSVTASPGMFLANASIIKKVDFPRNIIPLTTILQDMIHFVLSIPVLALFMLLHNEFPSLSWLLGIPILLIIQFLYVYGMSLLVSAINLFFRDLERLTAIFVTFAFFLTPIIYPETMIPEKYRHLLNYNPFAPLIISWRNLFLQGTLDLASLALSATYGIIIFMVGYIVYWKLSWKFAEVL